MSWDEALFSTAFEGAKRWLRPALAAEVLARRTQSEPERLRLEALARLLAGAPVSLSLVDELGGYCGDTLYLPRSFDAAPTVDLNAAAMVARVAWTCCSRALGFVLPSACSAADVLISTALAAQATRARVLEEAPRLIDVLPQLEHAARHARPRPDDDDVGAQALEALVQLALGAEENAGVCSPAFDWATRVFSVSVPNGASLRAAWPLLPPRPAARRKHWFKRSGQVEGVWLWGELMALPPSSNGAPTVKSDAPALSLGTESEKKKAVARPQRIEEPKNELAENPLVHSFEKVHTLEAYKGGSKRIDGDDEMQAHQKALDEVDLKQVVRSHQRAHSLYRSDVMLDGAGGEATEEPLMPGAVTYDEWDEQQGAWRRDWCRLSTHGVTPTPEGDAQLMAVRSRMQRTTVELRAVFEQIEASRLWRLRQAQGPDVDVDALVDRYGALKAGNCSDNRVYASRRRHSRSTAVLLLIDASLSTDAWVNNRRVIDVEQEAIIALGDALDGLFDEVAVAAFCSQTRQDCRFLLAKDFSEPWAIGARRVMGITPAGFTRIGPALRHGTHLLTECGAHKRLLLLLSDGKPSDLDRYEGRYGVADIHRAVIDAHHQGVVMHALAVDPSARSWLPSMFGAARASVVERPAELVDVLARVTSAALKA